MSADPGQDTRPGPNGPKGPGGPGEPGPAGPGPVVRTGQRAMLLGLVAIAMLFVPLLGFFAVVPAVAAIVIGVRARRTARQSRGTAPRALLGIVLGSVGLVFFVAAVAVQLVLYQEIQDYTKCENAANTIAGKNRCKDEFARDIERKFNLPENSIKGSSLPF